MEGLDAEENRPELLDISAKLFGLAKQIPELGQINDEDLRRLGEHFGLEPEFELFIRKIGLIHEGQKERKMGSA